MDAPGLAGLCAALEGIYGANYQQKFALSGRWEPEMACYAGGEGWQEADLRTAGELARSVIEARNLVNRPANMLVPGGHGVRPAGPGPDLPPR